MRSGLRVRILGTLLFLIIGLQLATSYVVLERTREQVDARARAELESGGRVFARLLRDRERQLGANVGVLVSDFALRRAVATGDRPTLESALSNHGSRMRASLAFLVGLDGEITAEVPSDGGLDSRGPELRALVGRAIEGAGATGVVSVGGTPHQVVLAPVKAPRTVGWIGMGFELDRRLANELRELADVEVTFWARRPDGPVVKLASTLSARDQDRLEREISRGASFVARGEPMLLPGDEWISLPIVIEGGGEYAVGAVLQTDYVAAMAPFADQRRELITIFAMGLAIALGVSVWMARRLTRPIASLVRAATAISAGDLRARVEEVDSRDEIGELARTFRVMQQAVAERETRIVYESLHDRLTGLPNRQSVEVQLGEQLSTGGPFGVALFDIVRLKDVNGKLGIAIGDAVLLRAAEVLGEMREVRWAARVGGGEFLTILNAESAEALEAVAERVLDQLEASREIRGVQVAVRFRAGIVLAPEDGDEVDVLMRRLELAIGVSKGLGGPIARYEAGLEEANQRRVGIIIELERALEQGDLELHYQPKIAMDSRRAVGAEALIRWTHADMGRMNPEEFIGIAEQTGFISRISDWVLREAVAQIARWEAQGIALVLSINLSAHDTADEELPDRILHALQESKVPGERLCIEITESAIMERPEEAVVLLERIRELGVRVSIDDFGTGHSSLAQLKRLPSDELKIDQAFVRHLRENTADDVIVRTTIELAHSLGLAVVAEGIEDRIAWQILSRHGCNVGQGYWMGRPMNQADFGIWLDRFEKEGLDG